MAQDLQRARSRSNSSYTAGTTFNLQMPLPPVKNLPPHLQAMQANSNRAALGKSQEIPRPADPLPKPPAKTTPAPIVSKPPASTTSLPPAPPPRSGDRPAAIPPVQNTTIRPNLGEARGIKALPVPPPTRGRSGSSADITEGARKQSFETINATTRRVAPRRGADDARERPISVATSKPVAQTALTVAPPPCRQPSPSPSSATTRGQPVLPVLPPRDAAKTAAPSRAAISSPNPAPPRITPTVPTVVTPSPSPPTPGSPQSPRNKQGVSPNRPRPPVPTPMATATIALPQLPARAVSPQLKRPASSTALAAKPHAVMPMPTILPNAPPPPPPSRGGRPNLRYQPAIAEVNHVPTAPKIEPKAQSHSVFTPDAPVGAVTEAYILGQTLGSGGFAEVVLGTHKRTQKKFAVKVIDKDITAEADKEALATELKILRKVSHPNIVKFFDFYDSAQKAYVVLELMQGGELLYTIEGEQANSNYTENVARRIMRQILDAVGYLHGMRIVHRDLKPENMLFTEKGTNTTLKLIDFGLAKEMEDGQMLSDWCGTPEFQAPEMVKRLGYNQKADVWSVGVILYILLAGQPPFRDNNRMKLYSKIVSGKYEFPPEKFDSISAEGRDLVTKLLMPDASQRMGCAQALEHQWFMTDNTAAAPIQTTSELHKYTTSRRFQNTGKQLMNCQRFVAYSKEEAVQDQQARQKVAK